jgi:hypothetical protein
MGAMDYLFPSATGRTDPTASPLRADAPPAPDADYLKLMQYLTQPKTDAGPDARRAMGGMPAGPKDVPDSVSLAPTPKSHALAQKFAQMMGLFGQHAAPPSPQLPAPVDLGGPMASMFGGK